MADSTSPTCTQSSRAGSPAAYGRPVTASVPRTCSWIRRTLAAACSATARSPKLIVVTYAEVAASLPTGSCRQSLCWSTPAMASGCSACMSSARRPATGPARSALIRQVTLPGPKNPSSAGCSGTPDAKAAAERSTSPVAVAYSSAVIAALPGWRQGRQGRGTASMWCRGSCLPNYLLAADAPHARGALPAGPPARRPSAGQATAAGQATGSAPGEDRGDADGVLHAGHAQLVPSQPEVLAVDLDFRRQGDAGVVVVGRADLDRDGLGHVSYRQAAMSGDSAFRRGNGAQLEDDRRVLFAVEEIF